MAIETPTRLGAMFMPGAPITAPPAQASPSASTPLRMLAKSGRFQSASLAFWQVVTTPTVRSMAAKPAARKAGTRPGSKAKDT